MEDNGDGTYGLCFAPTEAGPFELVVSLEKPGHAASKSLRRFVCLARVQRSKHDEEVHNMMLLQ